MNQRIFELAEQALEETYRVMGSKSLQEAFDDFYTERFAELIVQECMNVLHDNELWNRHINHALKEHFGVE